MAKEKLNPCIHASRHKKGLLTKNLENIPEIFFAFFVYICSSISYMLMLNPRQIDF